MSVVPLDHIKLKLNPQSSLIARQGSFQLSNRWVPQLSNYLQTHIPEGAVQVPQSKLNVSISAQLPVRKSQRRWK